MKQTYHVILATSTPCGLLAQTRVRICPSHSLCNSPTLWGRMQSSAHSQKNPIWKQPQAGKGVTLPLQHSVTLNQPENKPQQQSYATGEAIAVFSEGHFLLKEKQQQQKQGKNTYAGTKRNLRSSLLTLLSLPISQPHSPLQKHSSNKNSCPRMCGQHCVSNHFRHLWQILSSYSVADSR